MQYDKKDFNDQRVDLLPWWVILLLTLLMAAISATWYFVFPKFWPDHFPQWIAWAMFTIPTGIGVLIPSFYILRKVQRKRGTGPFKE